MQIIEIVYRVPALVKHAFIEHLFVLRTLVGTEDQKLEGIFFLHCWVDERIKDYYDET